MDDSYKKFLEKSLQPSLKATLSLLLLNRPTDQISFLGQHLRHFKSDVNGCLIIENCTVCNVIRHRNDNSAQSRAHLGESSSKPADGTDNGDLTTYVTSDQMPSGSEQLDDIIASIAKESWFQVDHWRKVEVIDAWNDLQQKYGDKLKWWHVAKVMENKYKPEIQPVVGRKAWKTIRVFVSSTFRDMFCEREWLVKKVFPELRSWCEDRKLSLIECDLRWGVPKDSKSSETLAACLNEIDRCRNENVMPYFVGLMGERYGWVPTENDFPEDLRKQYCWLLNMSVTSLELCTGTVWDNNPNAIIMFRDPAVLDGVESLAKQHGIDPDAILDGYREKQESLRTSLVELKKLIRERLPSEQIGEYWCKQDGLIADGTNRLNLVGYEAFGDRVLEFLKERISKQFVSVSDEALTNLEIQHNEMEQFMEERGTGLFGRDREIENIMAYVRQEVPKDRMTPTLTISGSAGTGKSSLMAFAAQKCLAQDSYKTVIHFVGATAGSTTLQRMISRLWYECLELPENKIPTDYDELKRSLDFVFRRASLLVESNDKERIIIFLDSMNQMDDDGDTLSLEWLPKQVPYNVRLVVSTLEGQTLDALRAAQLPEVKVEPLTAESRTRIVTEFFSTYNKKLSAAETEMLLQHEDAGRPLWLSMACEELRVFGTFELLDQKIQSLSGELLGLVQQIVERVISESPEGGDLIQAALSLIRASRFGLVEPELQQLLVIEPTLPDGAQLACVTTTHEKFVDDIGKLPMRTWALTYMDLRQFFRPVGSSGDGRLDFYHRSISKVVKSLMLENKDATAFWHRRLADYFDTKVTNYRRKAEELPFHLLELQDFGRLVQVLLDDQMFDTMYREDSKVLLLNYWRQIGGYKKAAQLYLNAFRATWPESWFPDKIQRVEDNPDEEIKQFVSRVLNFSSQHGSHDQSAACITGLNRVYPDYGDNASAWGPENKGGKEFIELEYDVAVFISKVIIYETYHGGAVSRVAARDPDGEWQTIYTATKIQDIATPRKFSPKIERPKFKSNAIRIETDGSVCNDYVQIDAVKLLGYPVYHEPTESDAADDSEQAGELIKQWVWDVVGSSSKNELTTHSSKLTGPYSVFPEYGDNATAWTPTAVGTANEFVEVEFEKAVYIAAICIYETFHAGGVQKISVQNTEGKWEVLYTAEKIEDIEMSRKFLPRFERPQFKSNRLRIEVDQSVCGSSVQIDAVALYGYNEYNDESIEPAELIYRELMEGDGEDDELQKTRIGAHEAAILTLTDEEYLKWLTFGTKLGWFYVDIGQFEYGEKLLLYLRDLTYTKYENQDELTVEIGRKFAETFYASVLLYRSWFNKFAHPKHPESKLASTKGKKVSEACYSIHSIYYDKDDLYFGEVVAACSFFISAYREEAIRLFEAKDYKRGLVELYSLKGTHDQYHDDIEHPRQYHDKAMNLAYSEFGKFHVKTARAHQLYGQTLWNRWTRYAGEKNMDRINELHGHYRAECEILENLYGPYHPLTMRSREDNIIVLEELGRQDEAAELRRIQSEGAKDNGN